MPLPEAEFAARRESTAMADLFHIAEVDEQQLWRYGLADILTDDGHNDEKVSMGDFGGSLHSHWFRGSCLLCKQFAECQLAPPMQNAMSAKGQERTLYWAKFSQFQDRS